MALFTRKPRSDLSAALASCRTALVGVGVLSAVVNALFLTGSFYMLQVYDRVLASRSVPTLVVLSLLAVMLFCFQGFLDLIRGRLMKSVGAVIDEAISRRVHTALVELQLKSRAMIDGLQPLRDLDSVRSFVGGGGPLAFFDLPSLPIYLALVFVLHWWLGLLATVCAVLLVAITIFNEVKTGEVTRKITGLAAERNAIADASRRNAEVLHAMGMTERRTAQFGRVNDDFMVTQEQASDVTMSLGTVSKIMRMIFASAVLGLGAYLVLLQELTPGVMIAASIITSRALAPVDSTIANWKAFVAARQSWERLEKLLSAFPQRSTPLALPRPASALSVEHVSAVPPGTKTTVVQDVTFTLTAGQGLGVIGPSASGKSSLARVLVGVWPALRGKIRLDGASIDQWSPEALGRHIGYLPQDVELFAGTVAENIARFESNPNPEAVIAASMAAGIHALVLQLVDGYETQIGDGGTALSAGQRQRVALARALYGDPFLVVLDEPNSNLDSEGEQALAQAIQRVRGRKGIVVVISHRTSVLASIDHVLIMAKGRMQSFGPRDQVAKQRIGTAPPMTVVEGDKRQ
jgi:PrtD family type I secretion system ABC transporter